MSKPTYVVVPVQADDGNHPEQDTDKIASAIQQSLHKRTNLDGNDHQERAGPLKEIIAHQDSLYKYISWEDPIRTLGSYLGALAILFGTHYLPLTQFALKAGATTLGVISVTEFASRSFGPNTFLARLRPKEYRKIPEPNLNATLKDIHDLIQYTVVQAQRIIFGQDLDKAFAAFLVLTTLYWLTKVVPPFWLAVLGLTSIYVAPLAISVQGRELANNAVAHAEKLTNKSSENGKMFIQGGKEKAAELSSRTRDLAMDTGRRVGNVAESGRQGAAELSTQARSNASDISGATAEKAKELPQRGTNAVNKTLGTANSALGDPKQLVPGGIFSSANSAADRDPHVSGRAGGATETDDNNTVNTNHYPKSAPQQQLDNTGSSTPDNTEREKKDYAENNTSAYVPPENTSASHSILNRPRGAALASNNI